MNNRREANRARLEATLRWLGETIGDDVEGYHTEMLSGVAKDVGKLRFIRDGAAYECDIVLRAVRVQGPTPEPEPGPVLEIAREITLKHGDRPMAHASNVTYTPRPPARGFTVGVACDHGIERGRFCRACDEEQ